MKKIALTLAITLPILAFIMYGWDVKSFSCLVGTDLEAMFLLLNITTSFCFLELKQWRAPGILLILLTCFTVHTYNHIHNFFAVFFFIFCCFSLNIKYRYYFMALTIVSSFAGIFWMETILTYFLAFYFGRIKK